LRAPITLTIIVIVLLIEFFIGNYFSDHRILAIDLISNDFYESDRGHYQDIFFYKHSRRASVKEVIEIFEK